MGRSRVRRNRGPRALLGDFVIGFAVAGIVIPSQTMIQQETPATLMGRVGATTMSLIFTAQISGLVLSGVLAGWIGVRNVFAVCAVLLMALIGAGSIWRGRTASEAAGKSPDEPLKAS